MIVYMMMPLVQIGYNDERKEYTARLSHYYTRQFKQTIFVYDREYLDRSLEIVSKNAHYSPKMVSGGYDVISPEIFSLNARR